MSAPQAAGTTHASFMPLETRCSVYARAIAATANADLTARDATNPEARLFAACVRFNALERRKIQLLKLDDGDYPGTEIRLARLGMSQAAHLQEMCEARATTIRGHYARALSFTLWDAGDLEHRALNGRVTEDLLLHALVRDLVTDHRR